MNKLFGDVVKFIGRYGDEALAIARGLSTILDGVALSPRDKAAVNDVIGRLETAQANIAKWVENPPEATVVKIDKKDIEAAVAKVLPKLLNDVVTKAVTEALAAEKAKDAANAQN